MKMQNIPPSGPALAAQGVSQHSVWIIQCLYWLQGGCVNLDTDVSNCFPINHDVRQVCVIFSYPYSSGLWENGGSMLNIHSVVLTCKMICRNSWIQGSQMIYLARARSSPPSLQAATSAALVSRWSALLTHAAATSFAASLLFEDLSPHHNQDGDLPPLGHLLSHTTPPVLASRLPAR